LFFKNSIFSKIQADFPIINLFRKYKGKYLGADTVIFAALSILSRTLRDLLERRK